MIVKNRKFKLLVFILTFIFTSFNFSFGNFQLEVLAEDYDEYATISAEFISEGDTIKFYTSGTSSITYYDTDGTLLKEQNEEIDEYATNRYEREVLSYEEAGGTEKGIILWKVKGDEKQDGYARKSVELQAVKIIDVEESEDLTVGYDVGNNINITIINNSESEMEIGAPEISSSDFEFINEEDREEQSIVGGGKVTIPVRLIKGKTPGKYTADIVFDINGTSYKVSVEQSVVTNGEINITLKLRAK